MTRLIRVAHGRSREDVLLFERYRRTGDVASREALVERFLPLARHLARRYRGGGEDEDLVQVASLGLLKAIDRFDPSRGIAFSSFAVPTILGELKRYFRDHGWAVRVPREVQELAVRLGQATDTLTAELRRAPTPAELALRCGVTLEQVLEALATETAHHPVAIERGREGDGDGEVVGPGAEDPALARVEDAAEVDGWLALLDEREQAALRLRFGHELRQREIGECLGISQMQVSRLIRSALSTLQQAAQEERSATAPIRLRS
jgi:RNA polymerase sigma-B factor